MPEDFLAGIVVKFDATWEQLLEALSLAIAAVGIWMARKADVLVMGVLALLAAGVPLVLAVAGDSPWKSVTDLPPDVRRPGGMGSASHVPRTLHDVERAHIERTLRAHNENRTRAARELGISRATLINKIKEYQVDPRALTYVSPEVRDATGV